MAYAPWTPARGVSAICLRGLTRTWARLRTRRPSCTAQAGGVWAARGGWGVDCMWRVSCGLWTADCGLRRQVECGLHCMWRVWSMGAGTFALAS